MCVSVWARSGVCVCVVWDIQFVKSSSTHSMQHALTIFNASRRARASATSGVDAGRAMAMVESACMAVYCCNTQPGPVYSHASNGGLFGCFAPAVSGVFGEGPGWGKRVFGGTVSWAPSPPGPESGSETASSTPWNLIGGNCS